MNTKPILGAGAILGAFAIAGVGLVVVTNYLTQDRIADNLREAMLDKFGAILPTAARTRRSIPSRRSAWSKTARPISASSTRPTPRPRPRWSC